MKSGSLLRLARPRQAKAVSKIHYIYLGWANGIVNQISSPEGSSANDLAHTPARLLINGVAMLIR